MSTSHTARLQRRWPRGRELGTYSRCVDTTLALTVVAAAGVAVVLLLLRGRMVHPGPVPEAARGELSPDVPGAPAAGSPKGSELLQVIRSLPGLVILLGRDGRILFASPDADRVNLTRRGELAFEELASIAGESAAQNRLLVHELALRRPPLRKGRIDLRVRAIPLRDGSVLLLIDDLTEEQRVATVRRDFIANVSHELKTPVGAISLLAEAMMSAGDDPAAVGHFAQRMHAEADRLANLINDVIDLSRLQGEDPLAGAQPVAVDDLVREAVDYVHAAAEAKQIEIVLGGPVGLMVMGMADQLVTAVRNLLANAISYSPENTRVAVAVRRDDAMVEIAVKDQGIGIDDDEQGRIFERFYRVDAARSRVTGGTGLGLAIVRHVCRNHGGEVSVWSVPGEGSTFTIQLPRYHAESDQDPTTDSGTAPRTTEGSQT